MEVFLTFMLYGSASIMTAVLLLYPVSMMLMMAAMVGGVAVGVPEQVAEAGEAIKEAVDELDAAADEEFATQLS